MNKLATTAAVVLLTSAGCMSDDAPDRGTLELELTDTACVGSFVDETADIRIEFSANTLEDGTTATLLHVNGMVLSTEVYAQETFRKDGARLVAHADGTAEDGTPTQILDADREAIQALRYSLRDHEPDVDSAVFDHLTNALSYWYKRPTELPLMAEVESKAGRGAGGDGIRSLCSDASAGRDVLSWHDCNHGSSWHWHSWSPVPHYHSGSHYAWLKSGPSGYYNGFAECSADPWQFLGGTQYTQDCADHDMCVSQYHGHWVVSGYCANEFFDAADDQLAAIFCW